YGPRRNLSLRLKTIYTMAFRRMRGAKIPIFVDVLVLSEFINAYSRIIYNDLPAETKPDDFKSFRQSEYFPPVAEEITKYTRRIVSKTERTESGLETVDLAAILNEYATGNFDFNDQILAALCQTKNLKLVTHDRDFAEYKNTILTANPRLLI
ncbi:MAG: PIN domain-containing protein, partial [Bacteroidia bacterium]